MNEKIIVEGKFSKKVNILTIILTCFSIYSVICFFNVLGEDTSRYSLDGLVSHANALANLVIFSVLFIISTILSYLSINNHELVLSDTRVSGKIKFGKKIDLPISQISSVSVGDGPLKTLTLATLSGKIKFHLLENRQELFSLISELLLSQTRNNQTHTMSTQSEADELKKFKDLLDCGAITQEEYNEKKKQFVR